MRCKVVSAILILCLAVVRIGIAPVYSLISDCDETFNYWEPLNLLVRGFGKQTWEYSPEYSIRSWAFLLPFYSILYPLNQLTDLQGYWSFFITRAVLGFISFLLEVSLFTELKQLLAHSVGNMWLLFQLFNPGWFHASVELLPSSVAMILYLGSIKYALRYLSTRKDSSFVASLTFTFLAGILGWPFVLVLTAPLCLHYLITKQLMWIIRTSFDCMVVFALITSVVVGIDSSFYGKFAPVSWNILMYNVLDATEDSGPNIFGTEPWHYYLINILLNIPFPTLLFSLAGFVNWKLWPVWLSATIWMATFIMQPHKEERFIYPIYGIFSLAASIGLHRVSTLLQYFQYKKTRFLFKTCVMSLVAIQAISRIAALVQNYSAPINVFGHLYTFDSILKTPNDVINVCAGREWYHFPNSFLLPDSHRLRFTASGFDGLLPGDFAEKNSLFESIRTLPAGMNNKNHFDPLKLTDPSNCDYYVDISTKADPTKDAFDPSKMGSGWIRAYCNRFIDAENSKILGRTFYVPKPLARIISTILPTSLWDKIYSVKYSKFCLFKKLANDRFNEL